MKQFVGCAWFAKFVVLNLVAIFCSACGKQDLAGTAGQAKVAHRHTLRIHKDSGRVTLNDRPIHPAGPVETFVSVLGDYETEKESAGLLVYDWANGFQVAYGATSGKLVGVGMRYTNQVSNLEVMVDDVAVKAIADFPEMPESWIYQEFEDSYRDSSYHFHETTNIIQVTQMGENFVLSHTHMLNRTAVSSEHANNRASSVPSKIALDKLSPEEVVEGFRGLTPPSGLEFGMYVDRVVDRGDELLPALIAAAADSDVKMRESVARCLGKIGSDAAVEQLIVMMKDEEVFDAVLIGLYYAKQPAATAKLKEVLEAGTTESNTRRIKRWLRESGQ